jgi:hypothetical protein
MTLVHVITGIRPFDQGARVGIMSVESDQVFFKKSSLVFSIRVLRVEKGDL